MSERHEPIDRLIEQSSLGTPDARAARASVPRAVARRIVAASTTANLSTARRNAVTGRYVIRTRNVRREG
jgi:hypothetical protein